MQFLNRKKNILIPYLHVSKPLSSVAIDTLGNDGLHVLATAAHIKQLAGSQSVVETVLIGSQVVVDLASYQGCHFSHLTQFDENASQVLCRLKKYYLRKVTSIRAKSDLIRTKGDEDSVKHTVPAKYLPVLRSRSIF
jgi:hypothetical protein